MQLSHLELPAADRLEVIEPGGQGKVLLPPEKYTLVEGFPGDYQAFLYKAGASRHVFVDIFFDEHKNVLVKDDDWTLEQEFGKRQPK